MPIRVLVVALLASALATVTAQSGRLDDAAVLVAIDEGAKGPVQGRPLALAPGGPATATAYSPAIRIALAAFSAASRGETLTLAHVPSSWRDPVVYIAIRSYRHVPDPGVSLYDRESEAFIDQGPSPSIRRVDPLWMSFDPAKTPAEFGAVPPYDDVALIAAFPLSAVREGWYVVGRRQDPTDRQTQVLWGARFSIDDVMALR